MTALSRVTLASAGLSCCIPVHRMSDQWWYTLHCNLQITRMIVNVGFSCWNAYVYVSRVSSISASLFSECRCSSVSVSCMRSEVRLTTAGRETRVSWTYDGLMQQHDDDVDVFVSCWRRLSVLSSRRCMLPLARWLRSASGRPGQRACGHRRMGLSIDNWWTVLFRVAESQRRP